MRGGDAGRDPAPQDDAGRQGARALAPPHLSRLEPELAALPGIVSVSCGRLHRRPAYTRLVGVGHYAASTMKTAVMLAAYRLADAGRLDLDAPVEVHDGFTSAVPGAPVYHLERSEDSDPEVWERIGRSAPLRWLVRRMVAGSSNLATNLVLERTGLPSVADAWRSVGAVRSEVGRGIEDTAARLAGITNRVTAADLAALLTAVVTGAGVDGPVASPAACREMREVLLAQEHTVCLPRGLPPGTPIAHKSGWVAGIRHGSGVVFPEDAPPYVLVVCTTTGQPDERMTALLARIAAASWADRHAL